MENLQTHDEYFVELPDYPFPPNYLEVDDTEGGTLRMHYLAEGPADGPVVLLMHGQPAWSYLYRHMIPRLVDQGYRVYAPDLIGFGKSDKPTLPEDYTYARHVAWLSDWLQQLNLTDIKLFCQDWGSMIGLRLVAAFPERFAGVVLSNGAMVDGAVPFGLNWLLRWMSSRIPVLRKEQLQRRFEKSANAPFTSVPGMLYWRKFCAESTDFDIGKVVAEFAGKSLTDAEIAAYNAPYPDDTYKAGARRFPSLAPIFLDEPEVAENRAAWRQLEQFDKPFMCAFSDADPVTRGGDKRFLLRVPGCKRAKHRIIQGAGHFVQQDAPEACVQAILEL